MNELGKKVKQLSQTSLCLVEIFIGKGISNEREHFFTTYFPMCIWELLRVFIIFTSIDYDMDFAELLVDCICL
jgi:hypothetical protein